MRMAAVHASRMRRDNVMQKAAAANINTGPSRSLEH